MKTKKETVAFCRELIDSEIRNRIKARNNSAYDVTKEYSSPNSFKEESIQDHISDFMFLASLANDTTQDLRATSWLYSFLDAIDGQEFVDVSFAESHDDSYLREFRLYSHFAIKKLSKFITGYQQAQTGENPA
jgi:hypothetical protein